MTKKISLKVNATQKETQEKKGARRPEADLPSIEEWEILQKGSAPKRQDAMPVRIESGGRSWLFSWLFGTKEKTS